MAYAPAEHTIGHGKELAYCDTVDGSYIVINGTQEVNIPERELGTAETTNDDSPDFHKGYIPSLKEPGTVGFTYVYGKTTFAQVEAVYALADVAATRASATKFWKYTLPDGSTAAFRGFITKHDLPAEQEDVIVCEGEIQVSGKMTFTAYTPA